MQKKERHGNGRTSPGDIASESQELQKENREIKRGEIMPMLILF